MKSPQLLGAAAATLLGALMTPAASRAVTRDASPSPSRDFQIFMIEVQLDALERAKARNDPLSCINTAQLMPDPACETKLRITHTSPIMNSVSFSVDCSAAGVDIDGAEVVRALKAQPDVLNAWAVGNGVQSQRPAVVSDNANSADGAVGPVRDEMKLKARIANAKGTWMRRDGEMDIEFDLAGAKVARQTDTRSNVQLQDIYTRMGIDRLRDAGLTGKGIKIGIVDGYVDRASTALAKTNLVKVVNASSAWTDGCVPDTSHTTGILGLMGGGLVAEHGFVGIAPDAAYSIYAITGCEADKGDDVLIHAMLLAAADGVDVIESSYGNTMGFPDDPLSVTVARITAQGIFVSIAAGNKGENGLFSANRPASGAGVAATGSSYNWKTPILTHKATSTAGDVRFTLGIPFAGALGKTITLWFPADGEATKPLAAGSVRKVLPKNARPAPSNVADTGLLVDWDTVWSSEAGAAKKVNIEDEMGLKYMVYYPPASWPADTGLLTIGTISNSVTGILLLDRASAELVKAAIAKGQSPVTLTVPADLNSAAADGTTRIVNATRGGTPADYSGWGPNLDAGMVPSFMGPSRQVLVPAPVVAGSWAVVDGTSYAAPMAAAVAALVKQARPALTGPQIRNLLIGTARPAPFARGRTDAAVQQFLAPVVQQGGGNLDAYAAVNSPLLVDVQVLDFNDTANRHKELSFTVTNNGSAQLQYNLAHVPAASGYLLQKAGGYAKSDGSDVVATYATIAFTPQQLTLAPGASAKVSVSVTADPQLKHADGRGVFFGGYVQLNNAAGGKDADAVRVPYTGIATALSALPMIDRDQTGLVQVSLADSSTSPLSAGAVFECVYDGGKPDGSYKMACNNGTEVPAVKLVLVTQSRFMRFSLIDQRSKKELVQYETKGPWDSWDQQTWWLDQNAAAGKYTWRVEALKLFGTKGQAADMDVFETAAFELKYSA